MNLSIADNQKKLNDLCDQIFDYFNLTIYDLESKIGTPFSINNIKNKLETFSDKHFKSALIEFIDEMQNATALSVDRGNVQLSGISWLFEGVGTQQFGALDCRFCIVHIDPNIAHTGSVHGKCATSITLSFTVHQDADIPLCPKG